MDRTASPLGRLPIAGRALAWAVVPALLVAGCTSDSGSDDATPTDSETTAEPTPEPVRFADLPNSCDTVSTETIGEVVPSATDEAGEELASSDVSASNLCLWSGLDEYDYRSLNVSLNRFTSEVSLGSGDERAESYLDSQVTEVTDNEANQDVQQSDLTDVGDQAASIGFSSENEVQETTHEFQQQRVVVRTGNVVVTVDYAGAGFEGADKPSAEDVKEAAERVAKEATEAVDATADEAGGDEGTEDGTDG